MDKGEGRMATVGGDGGKGLENVEGGYARAGVARDEQM